MKKIRITSDGGKYGTKIFDLETGEEIKCVTSLSLRSKGGILIAEITQIALPTVDVIAEVA